MFSHRLHPGACVAVAAAILLAMALPAAALNYDDALKKLEAGDYAKAEDLLKKEIDENPGHEQAYTYWAEVLEKLGNREASRMAWLTLKKITQDEQLEARARRNLVRLERIISEGRTDQPQDRKMRDLFHVPGIEVDYDELEEVDSTDYNGIYPPYRHETAHFIVYTCNQRLSEVVGELSEQYLAFLLEHLLDGRAWAFRVPVLVYADHDDYVKVGGMPQWSAGVTFPNHIGRSDKVAIYQLSGEEEVKQLGYKNRVSHNLMDVLPHELTHVVINEFFGAQDTPKWLHEAFARQMEQSRDDYAEAAELARDAVAGEYFRFRDFFAAESYPGGGKMMRFYEQAATTVLFLLEQGPEATRTFLTELAEQHGHDAAVAAAFGFSDSDGAVEKFEEQWVEWMKVRYTKDLKREDRETPKNVVPSESPIFRGAFDELASVEAITKWRMVTPTATGELRGIGRSLEDWELEPNLVRAKLTGGRSQSVLAVRMYEDLPIALKCKVRWTGDPMAQAGLFGITLLDAQMEDLGINALVVLADNRTHELVCVIGDDLVVYLDGKCTSRSPAPPRPQDVIMDYPVALLALAPVEIEGLAVATIESFKSLTPGDDDGRGKGRGRGKSADKGSDKGADKGAKEPPKKKKPKKKKPPKKKPAKKKPPGRI